VSTFLDDLGTQSLGDVLELAENGLFLGPFRNVSYTNALASFDPSDRLLLYTDGISEATFSDGEPFGLVRLRGFAAAQVNSQPVAFVNALMNTVSIQPFSLVFRPKTFAKYFRRRLYYSVVESIIG
jgi:serine phosphatase RsbU (regulator of sigma subunit)